jgi:hypothetical protein
MDICSAGKEQRGACLKIYQNDVHYYRAFLAGENTMNGGR